MFDFKARESVRELIICLEGMNLKFLSIGRSCDFCIICCVRTIVLLVQLWDTFCAFEGVHSTS